MESLGDEVVKSKAFGGLVLLDQMNRPSTLKVEVWCDTVLPFDPFDFHTLQKPFTLRLVCARWGGLDGRVVVWRMQRGREMGRGARCMMRVGRILQGNIERGDQKHLAWCGRAELGMYKSTPVRTLRDDGES